MHWKKFFGLLVTFQAFILAVNILPLHCATSGIQQVVVMEASLQTPFTSVYELSLGSDVIVQSIGLLGSDRFAVNETTLTVYNTLNVSAGRYSLTISVFLQGADSLSFISLIVVVIPEASQACELQLFGKCSQFCALDTSTYGYACSCAEGYILQEDRITCLAFDPLPFALVGSDGGVTKIDLLTRQNTPVSLSGTVDFFDYLYSDKVVFYADNTRRVISSVSVENNEERVVWSYAQETVNGLTVNWLDGALLCATDSTLVEVVTETGTNRTLHTSLNRPRHLAFHVDADQRVVLIWVEDRDSSFVIRRSFLNGSQPEDLHTSSVEPLGVSVDVVSGVVYWVTSEGNVCLSAVEGGVESCFRCCNGAVPSGLAVFEVNIYISLGASDSVVALERPILSDDPTSVVYKGITHASDLVVVHPLKQPYRVNEWTSCEECEQLCIVGTDSVRCDCSPGFRLSSDGTSCYIDEFSHILLSRSVQGSNDVIKVAPTGREIEKLLDSSSGPSGDPVTGLVYAMDYDRENGVVFYGDRDSSTVWRVSLDRMTDRLDDREQLLSGVRAWDLAFDWISHNLYWSDDRNGTIGNASVSTTGEVSVTTLLTGRDRPQGLEIDPVNRHLYWVESDNNSIWRCSLDDSVPEELTSGLSQPSDLAIDLQSKELYWSELSGVVGRMSLDGTNRQVLYNDSSTVVFKIALYKEYLLWINGTSANFNVLHRESTDIRGSVPVTPALSPVLNGLLVVGTNRQLSAGTYGCFQNVSGCSHYCSVDEQDTAVCTCPAGYTLSSNRTCTYEGACPVCTGGGSCVIQGSEISCSCPPGFMGPDCDQLCEEGTFGMGCAQQCTCMNGGDCNPVNGTCNCTEGYEGSDCGQAICTAPCQNGGTCSAPDICSCVPTYGGPTCNLRVCTSTFCFNGGTCVVNFDVDLSCSCPSFTSGEQCQFDDGVILFPQSGERIATSVGASVGVLFALVLLAIVVGAGIFYYLKCFRHRKTGSLEFQKEVPPASKYLSPEPPEAESTADTTRNQNFTDLEQGNLDSRYHVYVQT